MGSYHFDFDFGPGGDSPEAMKALFGKYAAAAASGGYLAIVDLAKAVQVSTEEALRDLQKLVSRGFFGREAYIDYLRKCLVLPQVQSNGQVRRPEPQRVYVRPQPQPQPQPQPPRREQKAEEEKKPASPLDKLFRVPRILLLLGGILLLSAGGIAMGGNLAEVARGLTDVTALIEPGACLAMGGFCFAVRGVVENRAIRYRKYQMLVGDQRCAQVQLLAESAGVGKRRALADLERMTFRGLFGPEALVDRRGGLLLRSPGDRPRVDDSQEETPSERTTGDSDFDTILGEIRQVNDEIDDYDVSQRINRIELITGKIFRAVEEHPEKRPQINSFMSYYLPTTLKLLRSYSTFEKQGVAGENITAAKQNIERILDTLAKGYEQQLDQLFQADALDISTDIDVLESMMKRDGLSEDGSGLGGQTGVM